MNFWQDSWLPSTLTRRQGQLFIDGVRLQTLVERFGTPLYVYGALAIRQQIQALQNAFAGSDPELCYAVKANDCHGILQLCADAGMGFDVVSLGELQRALRTGVAPSRIVFSGVGKSDLELRTALKLGLASVNVESLAEAERLLALAGEIARPLSVAVRVNPDVDPKTHPKIATGMAEAKFGVPMPEALALYQKLAASPYLKPDGIAFHIGSQLLDGAPIAAALERVLTLLQALRAKGLAITRLDLGGGFGIRYSAEQAPLDLDAHAARLRPLLANSGCRIALEPGRFIVGNAGLLLTSVLYNKQNQTGKKMVVVDAAMNDLMRPALYDAAHGVAPLASSHNDGEPQNVVGPICESTDVLAKNVRLPQLRPGEALCFLSAGAYGSVMAGTYNSRTRPAEVLVDGERAALLRPRETLAELLARDVLHLEWQAL